MKTIKKMKAAILLIAIGVASSTTGYAKNNKMTCSEVDAITSEFLFFLHFRMMLKIAR